MIWLMALPGLLIGLIPAIISSIFTIIICRMMYKAIHRLVQHLALYFETRYEPKVIYLKMSEEEIKKTYREMDIKDRGYNPFRHEYAMIELFPRMPVVDEIKAAARAIFPHKCAHLAPTEKQNEYQAAHVFFLSMLMERFQQIQGGRWSDSKEKLWLNMPYLPKQMHEIDDDYAAWCLRSAGREQPRHFAS